MGSRPASSVKDSLTAMGAQYLDCMPPIQGDEKVRSVVVHLRPAVVSALEARSLDALGQIALTFTSVARG